MTNLDPPWMHDFTDPTKVADPIAGQFGGSLRYVSCLRCGAAIILNPADPYNTAKLHSEWHAIARDEEPS